MKIIIDVMGGDNAPGEIVKGVVEALNIINDEIVIVGNESAIKAELKKTIRREKSRMKIIDLTQLITASMPVYPGTEPPHLTVANTYETDGFRETLLSFFSHTGTHMDAPFHLFGDRTKLNEMPAAQFVGKALVIPCMQYGAGEEIGMEALAPVRQLADETDFLLLSHPLEKEHISEGDRTGGVCRGL